MSDATPPDGGPLDINYLLDRLEEVLSQGSRLPFTSRALIDDEECFAILDQIRLSIPTEIRQARRVNAERDSLISDTNAQAEQVLRAAEAQAMDLVREHAITQQAQARAQEILAQADRQGDQIRQEADEYAYRVLLDLDRRLESLSAVVRNGLQSLQEARPDDEGGGAYRGDAPTR